MKVVFFFHYVIFKLFSIQIYKISGELCLFVAESKSAFTSNTFFNESATRQYKISRKYKKSIQNIIVLIIFYRSQTYPWLSNPYNLWFIFPLEIGSEFHWIFNKNGMRMVFFSLFLSLFNAATINIKSFSQCVQWPIKPTKCNYKAIIKKCAGNSCFIFRRETRNEENRYAPNKP